MIRLNQSRGICIKSLGFGSFNFAFDEIKDLAPWMHAIFWHVFRSANSILDVLVLNKEWIDLLLGWRLFFIILLFVHLSLISIFVF